MRARGSRFQRTEVLLLLLAFPLFTAGCGPRQLWGLPEDQLRAQLLKGDYSLLTQVDFSTQDPAQSLRLSPSAPFYLAFVFDSLARPDDSLRLLDTAWRHSPSPWKEEAGLLLARRDIEQQELQKRHPGRPRHRELLRADRRAPAGPAASRGGPVLGSAGCRRPCGGGQAGGPGSRSAPVPRGKLPAAGPAAGAGPHGPALPPRAGFLAAHSRVHLAQRVTRVPPALQRAGPGSAGGKKCRGGGRLGACHPAPGGRGGVHRPVAHLRRCAGIGSRGRLLLHGPRVRGRRRHGEARRAHGRTRADGRGGAGRPAVPPRPASTPPRCRGFARPPRMPSPRRSRTASAWPSWRCCSR